MFRRKQRGGRPDGQEVFQGLRTQILNLDPAEIRMDGTLAGRRVRGALMEMGYPNGAATLVALGDGTTSLYLSGGGGIIGAGGHAGVATATQQFLAVVDDHLALLTADANSGLPATGRVIIRALTDQGWSSAEAAQDDLGRSPHPLSTVFQAGHGVLTELRMIAESQGTGA
ncbi:MAG TPA: hypothetical protein VH589_16310 [Trebonia sp.]|jgi:hypothetical protein